MSAVIRRALLSVSDKRGLADFAAGLHRHGIELLATGGTARLLLDAGLPVREVSTYTGFPELMDGRLKTLHPRVHGGLLGRRGTDDEAMRAHGIEPIDLLVVNLYPFAATIARPDCSYARGDREHRHRRAGDAARGGQESCRRHRAGRPGGLRRRCWPRSTLPAAPRSIRARASRPRPSRTPRATTPRSPATCSSVWASRTSGFRRAAGAVLRQAAGPALWREPASAGRVLPQPGRSRRLGRHRPGAAGQGAVVQQHRRCRRGHRVRAPVCAARLRHRQARQSLRRGARRRSARGLHRRLPHRSDFRLRRHHRLQSRARRGYRARHHRAPVRRGHRRTRRERRRARGAGRQAEPARARDRRSLLDRHRR